MSSALILSCACVAAQEPTPEAAARAKTAVELVTKVFKINPAAKVPGQDKALDKDGSWSARPATPEERPAVCETAGLICNEVIYRAGQPEVVCLWTVLFPVNGGKARIVRDNDATATYMVVEKPEELLSKKNPDYPRLIRHSDLDTSSISGGRDGTVVVKVVVDTKGNVIGELVKSSTNEELDRPSLEAAAQYKFSPLLLDGRAQNFVLDLAFSVEHR